MALATCVLALAACASSAPSAATGTGPTAAAETAVAPTTAAPGGSGPASSLGASPAPSVSSPVTGVVIAVDSAGLAKVAGFTLRLPDGSRRDFRIGVLENGDQFPPGHLAEHQATAEKVRVYFRQAGDELVVYRLEDGG